MPAVEDDHATGCLRGELLPACILYCTVVVGRIRGASRVEGGWQRNGRLRIVSGAQCAKGPGALTVLYASGGVTCEN
jgi:hypothetical protein